MAATAAASAWRWQVGRTYLWVRCKCAGPCFFTGPLSTASPTFETIMEDLDVCAGETPRFAVVVEGRPVPDILWFKVFNPPHMHLVTF